MNFALNDFHDAELNRLVHDRLAFTASLVFRTEDSTDMEITFGGVCGLRVVDYGLQNVVSRLLSSSLANLTHADIV